MYAQEIMTREPACCTPDFLLRDVARLMVENDCGCIPVVDDFGNFRPIGIITDRDIACRTVAQNRNPLELTAADCMSQPCITLDRSASIDDCCDLLEAKRIRRLAIVDEDGRCCGIVAQADIAQSAPTAQAAEMLREISQPTGSPSNV
jgi:CBS domain-containing protein